jgi:hypothetical protein
MSNIDGIKLWEDTFKLTRGNPILQNHSLLEDFLFYNKNKVLKANQMKKYNFIFLLNIETILLMT